MIDVNVEYDSRDIDVWLHRANIQQFKKALISALNKTGSTVKTDVKKQIKARTTLKSSRINQGLRLVRASKKASITELNAKVIVNNSPLPLICFRAKQNKKGVAVNVKGTKKLIKHAFITVVGKKHKGVFQRESKPRLPIDELTSLSLGSVFRDKNVHKAVNHKAQESFARYFASNIRYFMHKK